jgi:hypothetical protein
MCSGHCEQSAQGGESLTDPSSQYQASSAIVSSSENVIAPSSTEGADS